MTREQLRKAVFYAHENPDMLTDALATVLELDEDPTTSLDPTADVTFALTTPSPDGSNTITGGGATKEVTVSVQNGTESVVLTATKTSAQKVTLSGSDASDVEEGPNDTNPTYTVNTTSVSSADGKKIFTLLIEESGKKSIVYTVNVNVASLE